MKVMFISAHVEDAAQELARLIGETNALLALAIPDASLADNVAYPTTLNFFGMPNVNFITTLAVMAGALAWTDGINVVCGAPARALFHRQQCEDFDANWASLEISRNRPFTKYFLTQSANPDDATTSDFASLLSKITNRRAILLLLTPPLLRSCMIVASQLNMTNGDYVFLTFSPQGPPQEANIFYKADDGKDDIALAAFAPLLVIPDGARGWKWIG
ncbi:hypothetical protein BV898_09123 [Hypsibius exemplaris]|uniref:Receptor ligand binding region domain-containing protein n=1 Tax=Hypsibius exemplaris TaxID=2072580 RepID=A0A1W0WNH7_HYPEX|nr:hypothetical protein BV898_09123 [Hypsibius exemplaris]